MNLLNYSAPPFAAYEFYNILDSEQWQQKQAWLSRLVNLAQADVMAFQEVFSADALSEQCQSLGYPYFLSTASAVDGSGYVYLKPGLALASKYPLQRISWSQPDSARLFSRRPLVAKVKLPGIGWVKLYVLHLKSKRPMLDEQLRAQATDIDEYIGRWQSDNLRSQEVSLLMQDLLRCRRQKREPVMLIGDFNDDLSQGELAHLFDQVQVHDEGVEKRWRLHDAYHLCPQAPPRPATHYYGGQANVLDYILVSGEFSPDYQQQMAELQAYYCFDRHLTHADFSIDSQASDHAAVMIAISPRS